MEGSNTEQGPVSEAASHRLAASVFHQSHDGILITDAHGTILDANAAFTRITGYRREEVIGKNPRLLKSGVQDDEFYAALWKTLKDEGVWRGEIVDRRRDGQSVIEYLTISAIFDDAGVLTHYLGIFSDVTVLREKQRELERLAHFDPLTGLPNRTLLMDRMRQTFAWARRNDRLVAVCYLDLDGFKQINDRNGHYCGDLVLVETARRLSGEIREGDTAARLGGDEFVLLLADLNRVSEACVILERLIEIIALPLDGPDAMNVSASIGVAIYPEDRGDPDALLRHADHAMYEAKSAGRATYRIYDGESGRTHARTPRPSRH